MYKHKCAYCNKEYETDTYYSKYCSENCNKLMEEQRKIEYANVVLTNYLIQIMERVQIMKNLC